MKLPASPYRIARHRFSSIILGGGSGSGSPSSIARAIRAVSAYISAARPIASPVSGCPSQIRISTVGKPRCGRTLHHSWVCSVIEPVAIRVGNAAAREHPREDLGSGRVQPGVHALDERRAGGVGEQLGKERAQAVGDLDGAVGAVDGDVEVLAEAVVAPDDVAQDLVVPAVVRRVDDPLLLPRT